MRVIVDPPGGRRNVFVFKEYRSPLVDPVLIGAVQTRQAVRAVGLGLEPLSGPAGQRSRSSDARGGSSVNVSLTSRLPCGAVSSR